MIRVVWCVLLMCSAGGCQMGRFAASLNRDTVVPKLDVQVIPQQWEPKFDDENVDHETDNEEIG